MSIMFLKEWRKCIALMERMDKDGKFTPLATAFIIKCGKYACLVTCKHVAQSENLWIRYNAKSGLPFSMIRTPITELEKRGITWCFHPDPDIDIAMRINYVTEDADLLSIPENLSGDFNELCEGDDIFFLGFPLGITEAKKVTPVVRSGIIALKKDKLTYLIEANAFPGSSGSPVFWKPPIIDWEKMIYRKPAPPKFVGIINSALTYTDYAISPQTGRPRVSFEENASLAEVYSIEIVKQVCESDQFREQEKLSDELGTFDLDHQVYYVSKQ
jgi:hypothetical protein